MTIAVSHPIAMIIHRTLSVLSCFISHAIAQVSILDLRMLPETPSSLDGLALDQPRPLQGHGSIHRQGQVVGGDVGCGAGETPCCDPRC